MKTIGIVNSTFFDQDQCIEFVNSVRSKNYKFQFYIRNNTYENLFYAGGMNEGIEKAYEDKVDYIFVGNADTKLFHNFLDTIIESLEKNPDYLLLSGTREDEVEIGIENPTRLPNNVNLPHLAKQVVKFDMDMAAFIMKREAVDIIKAEEQRLVKKGKMKFLTEGFFFDERILYCYTEDDHIKNVIGLSPYKMGKLNTAVFSHIVSYTSKSGHGGGAKENWARNFAFFKEKFGCEVGAVEWRDHKENHTDFKF